MLVCLFNILKVTVINYNKTSVFKMLGAEKTIDRQQLVRREFQLDKIEVMRDEN